MGLIVRMNKLILLALGCVLIAQLSFADEHCEQYAAKPLCDVLDKIHEGQRVRRQLPPPPPPGGNGNGNGLDKQLLERLLLEKLNFLKNFGLLKGIPFIGEFVHNLVEQDPEGVSKALSG